jgi:hypothetical protein
VATTKSRWFALAVCVSVASALVGLKAISVATLGCQLGDSVDGRQSFSVVPFGWQCSNGTADTNWFVSISIPLLLIAMLFSYRRARSKGLFPVVLTGFSIGLIVAPIVALFLIRV